MVKVGILTEDDVIMALRIYALRQDVVHGGSIPDLEQLRFYDESLRAILAKCAVSQKRVGLGGSLDPLPRKGEGRRRSGGEGFPLGCNPTGICETAH